MSNSVEHMLNRVRSFFPRGKSDKEIYNLIDHIYRVTSNFLTLPDRSKIRFKLSKRMVRKTGVFRFKYLKDGRHDMAIILSRKLLIDTDSNAEPLLSSLCHEICHASNFVKFLYGYCELTTHTGSFLEDMTLLNNLYQGVKPITVFHDIPVTFKWQLQCTDCGQVLRKLLNRGRLKKSHCHSVCGGLLQYVKIEPGNASCNHLFACACLSIV